jgi:hypothetical protein
MGLSRYSDGYEKTSASEQKITQSVEVAVKNIPVPASEHISPF